MKFWQFFSLGLADENIHGFPLANEEHNESHDKQNDRRGFPSIFKTVKLKKNTGSQRRPTHVQAIKQGVRSYP